MGLFNKLDRLWIDKIITTNKQEIVKIFLAIKKEVDSYPIRLEPTSNVITITL